MKHLKWHAGDDYNNPSGIHLYAEHDGWRYEIHKEVVRKGREWCWYVLAKKTGSNYQIEDSEDYHRLKDAKQAAQALTQKEGEEQQ